MRLPKMPRRGARRKSQRGVRRLPVRTLMMTLAVLAVVAWLFVSINPFQPANPFLRQITIGQSVLGDWRYGGYNHGELRFYDAYQAITLPATSQRFSADGAFVTIDGYTPTTLTFEPVVESEATGPLAMSALTLFMLALVSVLVTRHWPKRINLGRRFRSGRMRNSMRR